MFRISQTAPVRAIRNLPSNVCYGVGKAGKGIFNIVKEALLGVAYVFASIVTAPYKLACYLASKVSKKAPASAAKTQTVAAQVLPTKAADTTGVPILPGVPTPIIPPASQEDVVEATEVTPPTTPLDTPPTTPLDTPPTTPLANDEAAEETAPTAPLSTPPASPSTGASAAINSMIDALKGTIKAKWNTLSPERKEEIKADLAESYEVIVRVEQPSRGLRRPASPQAMATRQLQSQLLAAIRQA